MVSLNNIDSNGNASVMLGSLAFGKQGAKESKSNRKSIGECEGDVFSLQQEGFRGELRRAWVQDISASESLGSGCWTRFE